MSANKNVLVSVEDLQRVLSDACDCIYNETSTSLEFNKTGEPSTWVDYFKVAEDRLRQCIADQT